jgi:membrane protein DedA with SNARE-associated domain
MLLRVLVVASSPLPGWLQQPGWLHPITRAIGHLIVHHPSFGLFVVVLCEELGIPLPIPGDVAVMTGGYLTTTGAIPYALAYLDVIFGAVIGSLVLFTLSRRFGHPFLVRFGRYIGLDARRLSQAEGWFRRWGPWAIVLGRQVPGMRIVMTALAGTLEVRYRVFITSVLLAATIWATIFIEIGRRLGREVFVFFRVLPPDALPALLLLLIVVAIVFLAFEHGYQRPKRVRATLKGAKREADQPT